MYALFREDSIFSIVVRIRWSEGCAASERSLMRTTVKQQVKWRLERRRISFAHRPGHIPELILVVAAVEQDLVESRKVLLG